MVVADGAVQRLPPRADWPLLALCQAVLALPLVLLWAGLRRRRMRRLGEVPFVLTRKEGDEFGAINVGPSDVPLIWHWDAAAGGSVPLCG